MFQQTTAGEVSLYHITQLYRKVGMCLCRTEYQDPPLRFTLYQIQLSVKQPNPTF